MEKRILSLLIVTFILSPLHPDVRKARRLTLEKIIKNREFYAIPVPFPKSEQDVIKNMKAQLEKVIERSRKKSPGRESPQKEIIYSKIISGDLSASRIIKVVNHSAADEFEHDYLIEVSDNPGKIYMVLIMSDNGKLRYLSHESPEGKIPPMERDDAILTALRHQFKTDIKKSDIRKMEWITERSISGIQRGLFTPARKVILLDGTVYYRHRKKMYKVVKQHKTGPAITFRLLTRKNYKTIYVDNTLLDLIEELELLK